MDMAPQTGLSGRILFDTYNIMLPKGTGVATYARALFRTAGQLGLRPELIYDYQGSEIPRNLELATAILFEDKEKRLTKLDHVRNMIEAWGNPWTTAQAIKLPETSFLLEEPIRARLMHTDQRYIARNLYSLGGRYFSAHRKLYPIRFDTRSGAGRAPDIAHFTFQLPVRVKGAANLYTLHDLVPLIMPYATLENRKNSYALLKEIGRSADHIVTVSEHSRQDIIKVLGVSEDRVTNTYQAIDLPQSAIDKPRAHVEDEVSGIFNLEPDGYFLFFGAIEPKKNVRRLIEAYLSSRVRRPLVIVSSGGWLNKVELQLIADNPRRPDGSGIAQVGYLPYEFLVSLIKGARAVTFPSVYEGFGLPVLEAMALGTPVLTSNTSSLLEVAGDAAVTVDPISVESIRDGLRRLDADDDLRRELRQRGLAQARKFSADAYRERLSSLYRKVL
ncbi:glycosyltransferase [Microvirga tunisiensis]|uniref:Glycosyltransferase n=2 Tax=Pannonibacter tanglangensis TaxID=2750084 RepID=A0ABW9ZGK3_9HYPH|nr:MULTISPECIES: glycosyltransferase family 1 protein [unclassified Pannonibacter]NBN63983.1 glycosyltransferase [Pannonibacter sp. XCT-34]NBN77620.1 glycosyltransferase [Pannonibacter sp. XCT-53]